MQDNFKGHGNLLEGRIKEDQLLDFTKYSVFVLDWIGKLYTTKSDKLRKWTGEVDSLYGIPDANLILFYEQICKVSNI